MLNRKTILIIGGLVLLLGISGFVLLSQKQSATTGTKTGQETASSSGDLTNVDPSPETGGRGDLVVKDDLAAPFVTASPRSNEPLVVVEPTNGADFEDYNQAVASGLIPDKDGKYVQRVNPNYDPRNARGIDYTLNSDQFLSKYYGSDVVNDIVTGNNGFGDYLNSAGGNLVTVTPSTQTQQRDGLAVAPGATLISKSGNDNSNAAIVAYVEALRQATAEFDLVNNLQDTYVALINANNIEQLQSLKKKTETVKTKIAAIRVPSIVQGMSEDYYALYDQYSTLIDLMTIFQVGEGAILTEEQGAQIDTAYQDLGALLRKIEEDLTYVKQLLNV